MALQHQTNSTYLLVLNRYYAAVNGNPAALDQQLMAGIFDKATNQQSVQPALAPY